MREIGRYDRKLKKVVWSRYDKPPPENKSAYVIDDSMDPVTMVGLPMEGSEQLPNGKTLSVQDMVVDSKSARRQLLRDYGMVEMGNDTPDVVRRVREKRQHDRETRG